jgi:hypothetical protein
MGGEYKYDCGSLVQIVIMANFSERYGYVKARGPQLEGLDDSTRARLWNVANTNLLQWRTYPYVPEWTYKYAKWLAHEFFGVDSSQVNPNWIRTSVKQVFLTGPWHQAFALLEFLIEYPPGGVLPKLFTDSINRELELCNVGYRIINGQVAPITNNEEIVAISDAISSGVGQSGDHIKHALDLLSKRPEPDWANSIKESISAVENVCYTITGEHTLGQALKKLKIGGKQLHPALSEGLNKLYGWTSDADGIRHSLKDDPTSGVAEARLMLILCSAFVNYLTDRFSTAATKME